MTQILFIILPYIFFLLLNSLMVLVTKRQFGKCLPLTFMMSAFVLYMSQSIFKTFGIGFYLLIALSIIPIVIFTFLLIKRKKYENILKEFKTNYFDRGLVAFTVVYVFFTILDFARKFTNWDEFSHWGVMIKEMLRNDKFYSDGISTLMVHKDYPPIIQIFELLWTKVCTAYNEASIMKCLHIFEFSLFIPALYSINNNKEKSKFVIFKTLGLIIIAYLSMLVFDAHEVINTIYTDFIMAILLAYILYTIISEKDKLSYFAIFSVSLPLCFLVLTKQMGIPFFLISVLAYGIDLLFDMKKNKDKYKNEKRKVFKFVLIFICIIVIPLILWKSWGMYVEKLELEQQFKLSDIKIFDLPKILKGETGEQWQTISGNKFIGAVFTKNITTSNIEISFIQATGILLLFYIVFFIINKDNYSKGQKISIIVSIIIGAIGYTFVMLNMYVFSFGPREGPGLASFERYMDTYVIFMISLLLMMIFNKSEEKSSWKSVLLILAGILLIGHPGQLLKLKPDLVADEMNEYELDAEKIKNVVEDDAYVYILGVNEEMMREYLVKYYANPITTNIENYKFDTSDEVNPQNYVENIKDYILKYKYLYLKAVNEDFINKYGFLFKDNKIKEEGIYKINNLNNQIQFELICE